MMKEDRNPLRYMTNGIVAINFCWSKKNRRSRMKRRRTAVTWPLKRQRLLPCGGPECWWGTWTCMSGTGWRLAWWACRAWPPAVPNPSPSVRTRQPLREDGLVLLSYLVERVLLQPTLPPQERRLPSRSGEQGLTRTLLLILLDFLPCVPHFLCCLSTLCGTQVEEDGEDSTKPQYDQC